MNLKFTVKPTIKKVSGLCKKYVHNKTGSTLNKSRFSLYKHDYDYDLSLKMINEVYNFCHDVIEENKENYPFFDGWIYNAKITLDEIQDNGFDGFYSEIIINLSTQFKEKTTKGNYYE